MYDIDEMCFLVILLDIFPVHFHFDYLFPICKLIVFIRGGNCVEGERGRGSCKQSSVANLFVFTPNIETLRRPNCCAIEHKAILINFMAHLFAWHLGRFASFAQNQCPRIICRVHSALHLLLLENAIIILGKVEFALLC